jgi:SAM-dependent methyltransferase
MDQPAVFAKPETVDSADKCYFYHVMEIPGHGIVGGEWDLRDGVQDYVGSVELSGKRVLEIGPASGFITFHMESAGATVVSVELAPDSEWDFVPLSNVDMAAVRAHRVEHMRRLRNGYWFAHERLASNARVHYGSVYALPDELGRFDIGVLGCVLLHLRDPLGALLECARRCDRLVVTEVRDPALTGPVARFLPSVSEPQWHTWWRLSPDLLVEFLGVIGFEESVATYHDQTYLDPEGAVQVPMVTIVAHRTREQS